VPVSALERVSVAAIGVTVADLEAETKRAEAAGVECVWAPELFRSSVTQAAYLAGRTEKIDIATGIAWAFTRSPFILAVSALDIDEMSGGRFRLGLGSGVKRLNETWHNAEYGKPAPHMRESIEATRLIMQQAGKGEPIRYEGSYYDIDIKGWIRPHPAARESVPIYTAGVQGGMCRMAGDVADGLIGGRHRSNAELMAQGIANIASPLFGGIPATGAIARTATNVRNGGRSPVAGIVHAATLLAILLVAGTWASRIPMATLAGILMVVAYNMSEWKVFVRLLRSPRSDVLVMATTFLLTVLIDLTVALEVGMVLAAVLFMRRMAEISTAGASNCPPALLTRMSGNPCCSTTASKSAAT